ncbi:MCE-family protein [Mycolicibacterium novocastrense]|nr:MCE-family protein [Mycolicibacterium novocastrense]KUH64820.1 MCE-family protein [Mycolicibacterium novocastrense]KUH76944.1 MCE-family protein [Mycolicibacterium novocastrense]
MAAVFAVISSLTYLAYSGAFIPVDTVTVTSARAGLVMDREAKVKYLGVEVGKVSSIEYDGAQAELTLEIRRDQMNYIPSNVTVRIASNTVFGAKSVEFLSPTIPDKSALAANSHLHAAEVAVEANTLFETLVNTLKKIDPVELNATMTAIGEGLRGNGRDIGTTISTFTDYMGTFNPHLPTLQSGIQKVGEVADIYAEATPDLLTLFDNTDSISNTIVDQQENLATTLMAAVGLGNTASDVLEPSQRDLIAAIQRLRAPLKVLGDYSPQLGCLLAGLATTLKEFAPAWGGTVPGVFMNAFFIPGVAPYTYPESLPIVNASGGPNCRGLPNLPGKMKNGSWFRPQFLVTDNAYIPYQPNTELQFDPLTTFQFLFNGAYAERDDY